MTTENQSGFDKDQFKKALLDVNARNTWAKELAEEGISSLEAANNLGNKEVWDQLCQKFHKEISAALKKTQAPTEPLFISIANSGKTAHRDTNGWVDEHIKAGGSYIEILNEKHPKYVAKKAFYEKKEKETSSKPDADDQPQANSQESAYP